MRPRVRLIPNSMSRTVCRFNFGSCHSNLDDALIYYKASIGFPLIFAVRRNAAFVFWRQGGYRNDWLCQSLYHILPRLQKRVLAKEIRRVAGILLSVHEDFGGAKRFWGFLPVRQDGERSSVSKRRHRERVRMQKEGLAQRPSLSSFLTGSGGLNFPDPFAGFDSAPSFPEDPGQTASIPRTFPVWCCPGPPFGFRCLGYSRSWSR